MSSLLLLNGSPRGPRSNSHAHARPSRRPDGRQPAATSRRCCTSPARRLRARGRRVRRRRHGASRHAAVHGLDAGAGQPSSSRRLSRWSDATATRGSGSWCSRGSRRRCTRAGSSATWRSSRRGSGRRTRAPSSRGGGEALQAMPDEALRGLFGKAAAAGRTAGARRALRPETLPQVAGTERFSAGTAAALSVAFKLPVTQFYWNGQLKKNGAWGRRFAAPYAKECAR